MRALVAAVLAPALGPALYLYTTPPRQLLKDAAESLYHAQLVPAAHIHAGLDEKKGAWRGQARHGGRGTRGTAGRWGARTLVLCLWLGPGPGIFKGVCVCVLVSGGGGRGGRVCDVRGRGWGVCVAGRQGQAWAVDWR